MGGPERAPFQVGHEATETGLAYVPVSQAHPFQVGGGGLGRSTGVWWMGPPQPQPRLRDIPSGCCFFPGPWTVTCSSLRKLRRVAAFCRLLRPVLLLVLFLRSRSPVAGVPGLCWLLRGSFDGFHCPRTSALRSSTTCLIAFPCVRL